MSYSIPHTVGVQPDFKSVKHSDLSKCVLERPGATSLQDILREGGALQGAMAVGCLLLVTHCSGHVRPYWRRPPSLILLATVSQEL